MDGTRFLKTANFGGFDKKDVLNMIDEYNSKINALTAELDEKKALAESSNSAEADAKYQKLLDEDKKKIAELATSNDSLKVQLQTIQDESAAKDKIIEELKAKNVELENELVDAKNKAAAATPADNNAMDMTNIFLEAQKTANQIVKQAKENSAKLDEDAKKLANQVVDDANSKASTIVKSADERASKLITDAETKSAEIISEAEDRSAEMKAATAKMKAIVIEELQLMDKKMADVKAAIESLAKESTAKIDETKGTIKEAEEAFNNGKIPPSMAASVPAAARPAAPAPKAPVAPSAPIPGAPAMPKAAPAAPVAPSAQASAAAQQPQAPAQTIPSPVSHTPMKPIPQINRQPAAPKPTPKISFDLSEIEQLAKGIEEEASRGK